MKNNYKWREEVFPNETLINSIEFPCNFDFDNLMVEVSILDMFENFKLNYFNQLLNDEKNKLEGEENIDKSLTEAAKRIIQKTLKYNIDLQKLKAALKESDSKDTVMAKLIKAVNKMLTSKKL